MESLTRLCWRLSHSTEKGYCALSLRGSRLGVRLVMAGVAQPTSSQGSRRSGRIFFTLSIARLSVTQASAACKVGFGRAYEGGRAVLELQRKFLISWGMVTIR